MSGVNISSQQLHEILTAVTELTDLQLTQNPKLEVMTFATSAFAQLLRELRHHVEMETHGAVADIAISDARKHARQMLNPTEEVPQTCWRVVAMRQGKEIRSALPDEMDSLAAFWVSRVKEAAHP